MGNVQVQELSRTQATGRKMALVCEKTRAKTVCALEQTVFVLLNDKSRMKGDIHVRFREKFEVKLLLLTRLRGRNFSFKRNSSYSIIVRAVGEYETCKKWDVVLYKRPPKSYVLILVQAIPDENTA